MLFSRDKSRVNIRSRTAFIPSLGPTDPPTHWILGALPPNEIVRDVKLSARVFICIGQTERPYHVRCIAECINGRNYVYTFTAP
jgi:hypothetical protein